MVRFLNYIFTCLIIFSTYSNYSIAQENNNSLSFNKINVSGKLNVRLEKSNSNYISVKSKEIDIKNIKYHVKNNTLTIRTIKLSNKQKGDVTIGFKNITSINVSSGASLYNYGTITTNYLRITGKLGCEIDLLIKTDTTDIKVTQGAFIRLRGSSNHLNVKTSLSGDLRADELQNKTAIVKLSGGSAFINTSNFLDANVKNGATLKLKKQPQKIKKKTSLNGTISSLDKL